MARRTLQHFILATSLAVATVVGSTASARTIRVDVGSFNYPSNGQAWQNSETPLGPLPVLAGSLPFALNFGTGLQTGFCLGENGTVGFASNCGAVPANALLQVLGADWISDPNTTRIFELGSVTYTEGRLAAEAPFPADPNDAPRAVRFHWNDVGCTTCGGDTFSFQAILIDVGNGNGDFDLEFNFGDIPAGIGLAQIALGSNFRQFGGPFSPDTDYDFQFRNGVLVNGPTPVPEPATVVLLVVGLLTLQTLRRRRSR